MAFSSHPFEKKKCKLKKLAHLPPSLQGVEDPFGPSFPQKKCHSFTQNDIASSFRNATQDPLTPPKKKKNTSWWGRKWTLGNAQKVQNGPKKGGHLLLGEKSFGVMFLSPKGWLNWCNLQASPLFFQNSHSKSKKKLDKFPPIKVQKQKSGS